MCGPIMGIDMCVRLCFPLLHDEVVVSFTRVLVDSRARRSSVQIFSGFFSTISFRVKGKLCECIT